MIRTLTLAAGLAGLSLCAACADTGASTAAETSGSAEAASAGSEPAAQEGAATAAGTGTAAQSQSGADELGSGAATTGAGAATHSGTHGGTTGASAAVSPATAADLQAGATVNDQTGQTVGVVESVTAEGAVIFTGKARGVIPLASIGKTATGLVTSATKAQIEAAAATSSPQP